MNIIYLVDELLLNIFQNLRFRDLNSITRSSSRFSEVINEILKEKSKEIIWGCIIEHSKDKELFSEGVLILDYSESKDFKFPESIYIGRNKRNNLKDSLFGKGLPIAALRNYPTTFVIYDPQSRGYYFISDMPSEVPKNSIYIIDMTW